MDRSADDGFLSRWSRRKAEVRQGRATDEAPVVPPAPPATVVSAAAAPVVAPPSEAAPPPAPPTLEDVAALTRDSDYTRFVRHDVDTGVRNAALKKLFFSDPHFNVMDGLDIYIDDYGKPDPLPEGMLERMAQTDFLGLGRAPEAEAAATAAAPPMPEIPEAAVTDTPAATALPADASESAPPHEDPDLRLQPDDAAGCPGDRPRAGDDTAEPAHQR